MKFINVCHTLSENSRSDEQHISIVGESWHHNLLKSGWERFLLKGNGDASTNSVRLLQRIQLTAWQGDILSISKLSEQPLHTIHLTFNFIFGLQ